MGRFGMRSRGLCGRLRSRCSTRSRGCHGEKLAAVGERRRSEFGVQSCARSRNEMALGQRQWGLSMFERLKERDSDRKGCCLL